MPLNLRSNALWLGCLIQVFASWAVAAPGLKSAVEPGGFDLEARKQQQPWLWQAPRRQDPPAVRNESWPSTPEDRFILSRLETAGLTPAAAADDRTWLRRLHFVITGLPPSREEIHAFLDDTSAGARERAVDRLLASHHFGERWARHWMDLMRYAESRGHEGDYIIANAWHYRDYLIRALNSDLPYDRFLTEHLAGDVLPEPRFRPGTDVNESVLATGWAFLGEENHSPVDIRQDECERVDNKVDVFSKTFLGLTVSCARCHDHKFDPIRAQDYYALSGFMLSSSFRQVRFESMDNNRRMAGELQSLRNRTLPRLARETAAVGEAGVGRISDYLLAAHAKIQAGNPSVEPSPADAPARSTDLNPATMQLWIDHLARAATNSAEPLHWVARLFNAKPSDLASVLIEAAGTHRTTPIPSLPADARVVADFTRAGVQAWKVDGEAFGTGPALPGQLVTGTPTNPPLVRVMMYGAARRDPFWNRLKTAPGNENDSGRLGATHRAGQMIRTPTVTLASGSFHYLLRGRTRVYAAVDSHIMLEGPLHGVLTQTLDGGTGPQPRWVSHDLSAYAGHRAHIEFGPDGTAELEILMVVESPTRPTWIPPTDGFRPSAKATAVADVAAEFQGAALAAWKRFGRSEIEGTEDAAETAALADWILRNPGLFHDSQGGTLCPAETDYVAGLREIESRVKWESQTAAAWFDGTGVDEHVLLRGKPFKPGVLSPRSLPAAFVTAEPITPAASSGRLELARQLVDPSNPLVARALVNRVWHHVFGRGIVATVDNFGSLGERPTHPELLDHMAWRFVHEDGWSIKRLIRRMVLTRAFGMSSLASTPRGRELDPSNALLHRMPIRRLEGEVIRDALLTVSGRLNPTVGGPPVPVHLTEFLVGRGRPEKSGPLDGDGRRSVYSAMRRNFLPTLMQTFDAPTPFSTVGKRNVTNVPAQSLALMNDPLFHQQARVWAERMVRETPGAEESARISRLFEAAYGRLPTVGETQSCRESLDELRTLHQAVGADSLDVWSDLCHALLNANDFIYVK